jgi:hypothetical protein
MSSLYELDLPYFILGSFFLWERTNLNLLTEFEDA